MAKNGYDQTYEDDRKENEETANLLPRAGRAIAGAARSMYNAATGKDAKDFEPRDINYGPGSAIVDTDAVRSPVGSRGLNDVRSVNMGEKSKSPKASDFKKGGKVSSASKRADGCITKGHTKGRFV